MATVVINGKCNTEWQMDFLGKTIESPSVKTTKIDIPMRDGYVDLTEDLDGIVRYNNRQITMRFEIRAERNDWQNLMISLYSEYHGKRVEVTFDDDPEHFWTGRCTIGNLTDHKSTAGLEIVVDAEPFRRCTKPLWYAKITVGSGQRYPILGTYGQISSLGHPRGYIAIDTSRTSYNNWTKIVLNDGTMDYRLNYAKVIKRDINNYLPSLFDGSSLTVANAAPTSQNIYMGIYGGDL